MDKVYDIWERLVRATTRRDHQNLSGQSGVAADSLQRTTNINAILQAADEIQAEDPHVARILGEQAYIMAQNLDPNSDGRGVLQFNTNLKSVIQQKLARKEGERIDRSCDDQYLWDFYLRYKQVHRVDEIMREERRMLESGTFSADMGGLGLRSQETRKVFTTLRALVEVLEVLSEEAAPDGVGRHIKEELKRLKKTDQGLSGDLMPYNIVPLEAPSLENATGFHPEDNWKRLVRATIRREQQNLSCQSHERKASGIAGLAPDSLQRTTNINAILQAADEIQAEDAHVARILGEQAYIMAQNLDPNSDGRGVLQFKTGLKSVIQQKLARKEGERIDRSCDDQYLWDFYQRYKQVHKVDEIMREERRMLESGTINADMGGLELRSQETRKVFTTLRALVVVLEVLSKEAAPDGVGRHIKEELKRLKKTDQGLSGDLMPYNVVPFEAPSLTNATGFYSEDNWKRLVRATIRREQQSLSGQSHERKASGIAGAAPDSFQRTTNINAILQAADEIQAEDAHVARILGEQAYIMAQNLDPNSEGRGVLQFKTGLKSVIQQKLARKEGGRIDRSCDDQYLWDFYLRYKQVHRVDEIMREERRMLESGTFSADIGGLGLRSQETTKVFTTLRALVEVLEVLSKEATPDGVGRHIKEELNWLKKTDQGLSGDLMPYNIVPLEAPSMTNAIGFYPEDNWKRLVRATIRREQQNLSGQSHERKASGLADAAPDSLQLTTNINAILQAADEIQAEDMHVARILCEQAYSMAQNLDPNSDGRGVLQFRTGLMSVIKQRLAIKEGGQINRKCDDQYLWDFYQRYKQVHRVDEIMKEERRMLESGTFSADMGGLGLRSQETTKVFTTLRALVEALEVLSKEAAPDGVGRHIKEELKRLKKTDQGLSGDLMPYNIVPLEAPSLTNATGFHPELLLSDDDAKGQESQKFWDQFWKKVDATSIESKIM